MAISSPEIQTISAIPASNTEKVIAVNG